MRKPLSQYLPDYTYLLAMASLIVFVDQATKVMVRLSIPLGGSWTPFPELIHIFRFVHWGNTGAAFGIFQNGNTVFLLLGIFVTLAIINFYPIIPRQDRWLRAALGLQLGGAIGNLIDRILHGHVTDFLSFFQFPVFNIADMAISLGVVLILVPFLPELFNEVDSHRQMRLAKEINRVHRIGEHAANKRVEEPMTFGLVEVLLADNAAMQRFSLSQDVLRIREYRRNGRRGSSRG